LTRTQFPLIKLTFSSPSAPIFSVADALRVLEPTNGIHRTANQMAHDLIYHDIYIALSLLKERDPLDAAKWESLVVILTGKGCMSEWDGNMGLVKDDCMAKRAE
jgi:hypothetical protein